MTRLAVALFVAFMLALGVSTSTLAQDRDCGNFGSQAEAQAYFESGGGSPSYNFNLLDANHDGVACEDYGYSGSGAAPAPAAPAPAPASAPAAAPVAAPVAATLPRTGVGISAGIDSTGTLFALFGLASVSALAALRARRA